MLTALLFAPAALAIAFLLLRHHRREPPRVLAEAEALV
jgi:hypothetical protein